MMAETTQAIMKKAIGEVWAKETEILLAKGCEPVLRRTRWMLLERPENLTERGATVPASRRG